MSNRRAFLTGSTAALCASITPAIALSQPLRSQRPGKRADKLALGDEFSIDVDGVTIAHVQVDKITQIESEFGMTQFSLSFRHISGEELSSGTYRFIHSSKENLNLYVVSNPVERGLKTYRTDISLINAKAYDPQGLADFVA